MVDVKELRVGNKVYYGNDKVIVSVTTDFLYFEKNNNPPCRPIPLTPEILDQCGFEFQLLTDYPGWYSQKINGSRVRIWAEGISAFVYSLNDFHNINLTSLHQLQNLYFALTNEELIFQSIKELK